MIGSFGKVSFTASENLMRTFRNMSKKHSARYAKYDLIGKKPLLAFIGPDTKVITFDIRLDISHGVNPQNEVDQLEKIKDAGEAAAFTLGKKYFGLFVLKDFSEKDMIYDNKGGLWVAELSLNLEEYADDRV